jgi:hypothetical protein
MGTISLRELDYFENDLSFDSELCLTLPETVYRFRRARKLPGDVFTGLRHQLGWIGCGMSYKKLANQALQKSYDRIVVFEDDVVLPKNYGEVQKTISNFLDTLKGDWHIFSGLISNLDPETEILSIESFGGLEFVTLNRMTSTVYNMFSKSGLELLSNWDENNFDLKYNTIDQYLGRSKELRVVTVFPFLFGHDNLESSTLWGFNNGEYEDSIVRSSKLLQQKIDDFRKSMI